jgi:hypothetical protein
VSRPLGPDDLWLILEPLLPPEPPKPKGGRPRTPDRKCLAGTLFVLKTGLPWEDFPQELGCRPRARASCGLCAAGRHSSFGNHASPRPALRATFSPRGFTSLSSTAPMLEIVQFRTACMLLLVQRPGTRGRVGARQRGDRGAAPAWASRR